MWERWLDFWANVEELVEHYDGSLIVGINGDMTQGYPNADRTQLIDYTTKTQHKIVLSVCNPFMSLKPLKIFATRGTECHVGLGGSEEEFIAEKLRAEQSPEESQTRVPHEWRFSVYGIDFHMQRAIIGRTELFTLYESVLGYKT